ncbi:hypothetical protein HK102_012409, partial [Quaeritorhiza haematococci]
MSQYPGQAAKPDAPSQQPTPPYSDGQASTAAGFAAAAQVAMPSPDTNTTYAAPYTAPPPPPPAGPPAAVPPPYVYDASNNVGHELPSYGAAVSQNPPYPQPYGTNPGYYYASPNTYPSDIKVVVAALPVANRMRFIRKVYALLTLLIAITAGMTCVALFVEPVRFFLRANGHWLVWTNLVFMLITLFLLIWVQARYVRQRAKASFQNVEGGAEGGRKSPPVPVAMYTLLGLFCFAMSFTVATYSAHRSSFVILNSFLIATGVFVGLSLFTVQSKWDFSGMFPYLY